MLATVLEKPLGYFIVESLTMISFGILSVMLQEKNLNVDYLRTKSTFNHVLICDYTKTSTLVLQQKLSHSKTHLTECASIQILTISCHFGKTSSNVDSS